MTLNCKKTNLRAYQHIAKSYLNQKIGTKMQTNTLNTGEAGRKAVYIFITLAGFFCLVASTQLMGSDNPRIQENTESSKVPETQQSLRDRIKERWKMKTNEARQRKELQNLVDQAEKAQSVALSRQDSNSHKTQ